MAFCFLPSFKLGRSAILGIGDIDRTLTANEMNPILSLKYEPAIESLGNDYYDDVAAAEFPQQILRFRNDDVLTQLGLSPSEVRDEDFVEAFGKFASPPQPLLAIRTLQSQSRRWAGLFIRASAGGEWGVIRLWH
jgi:hypothetical protein